MNPNYPYYPGCRPAWHFHRPAPAPKPAPGQVQDLRARLAKAQASASRKGNRERVKQAGRSMARRLRARIEELESA